MLRMETCATCAGRKIIQRMEECVGGNWRPLPASAFDWLQPWHRADAMRQYVEAAPTIFRWADCHCPACEGQGEYVVEHFACKIF